MNPDLDRMTVHAWQRLNERNIAPKDVARVQKYAARVLKDGVFICQFTGREIALTRFDDQESRRLLDVVVVLSQDDWIVTVYTAA